MSLCFLDFFYICHDIAHHRNSQSIGTCFQQQTWLLSKKKKNRHGPRKTFASMYAKTMTLYLVVAANSKHKQDLFNQKVHCLETNQNQTFHPHVRTSKTKQQTYSYELN